MKGCLKLILLVVLAIVGLGMIASLNRLVQQVPASNPRPPSTVPAAAAPSVPASASPEPLKARLDATRRVPHPGPVVGDMDRIFAAAREQRKHRTKREEGDEKDIAQIKAVYTAEKLGLPVRIVATQDWPGGFRYIVVTGKHATHVAYLTPESEVVSVREVYDSRGTPKGLAFLFRRQE